MEHGAIIEGYQELQAAAYRLLDATQPSGALGAAVYYATKAYAQGTASRAHEDTGTLAAAQTPEAEGLRGRIYTADRENPKSGQSASIYAPAENARGGAHGFYDATFRQDTPAIAAEALAAFIKALP